MDYSLLFTSVAPITGAEPTRPPSMRCLGRIININNEHQSFTFTINYMVVYQRLSLSNHHLEYLIVICCHEWINWPTIWGWWLAPILFADDLRTSYDSVYHMESIVGTVSNLSRTIVNLGCKASHGPEILGQRSSWRSEQGITREPLVWGVFAIQYRDIILYQSTLW